MFLPKAANLVDDHGDMKIDKDGASNVNLTLPIGIESKKR